MGEDIWSILTKTVVPTVGNLKNKNVAKCQMPHICPSSPSILGLTIDRCITLSNKNYSLYLVRPIFVDYLLKDKKIDVKQVTLELVPITVQPNTIHVEGMMKRWFTNSSSQISLTCVAAYNITMMSFVMTLLSWLIFGQRETIFTF